MSLPNSWHIFMPPSPTLFNFIIFVGGGGGGVMLQNLTQYSYFRYSKSYLDPDCLTREQAKMTLLKVVC